MFARPTFDLLSEAQTAFLGCPSTALFCLRLSGTRCAKCKVYLYQAFARIFVQLRSRNRAIAPQPVQLPSDSMAVASFAQNHQIFRYALCCQSRLGTQPC